MAAPGTLPPGWKQVGVTTDLPFSFGVPVVEDDWLPPGKVFVLDREATKLTFETELRFNSTENWDGFFSILYGRSFWEHNNPAARKRANVRRLGAAMRRAEAREASRSAIRSLRRYLRLRALLTPHL